MNRPKTTSWMWRDEDGGTSGADLDFSNGVVRWFDGIACACDDNKLEQTRHVVICHWMRKASGDISLPVAIR